MSDHGPSGIWGCQIGDCPVALPGGSDLPMRDAVADAYRKLTGRDPEFIFSGWRDTLTEERVAVVEDRLPDPEVLIAAARKRIDEAMEEIDMCERWIEASTDV